MLSGYMPLGAVGQLGWGTRERAEYAQLFGRALGSACFGRAFANLHARGRVNSGLLSVVREGTHPHTYSTCAHVVGASDYHRTRAVEHSPRPRVSQAGH